MSADTTNAEQQLLALYDRIADAPDAIGRLRRFVLDLAVRGKLVAQDLDDEPVSELLKQVAVEKERLIKAGEIRKPRNLSNGEELRPPFEIPATWRWCRLDTIGAIIGGGTPAAGDPTNFAAPSEGVPWLTPADLGDHRELYISGGARDLSQKGLQSSSATLMPTGTVLFTSRAPIGYVAISTNPISTNQGFKSIVPYVADCSRFIALAMQAFASEIDAKAPGTTFKEVSGKIVAGIAFPLPPLAEQHRIMAKVEELMALLDRLEATRTAAESTRDRLTAASLSRLTAPDATSETFSARARFALDAMPSVTARADQIHSLRQTILNLAVRGKLVEQDWNAESAGKLLMKRYELPDGYSRRRKIIKKASVDASAGLLASIPETWVYVGIQELYDLNIIIDYEDGNHGSLYPRKSEFGNGGVTFVSAKDLTGGKITWDTCSKLNERRANQLNKGWAQAGDILLTHNATVGKVAKAGEQVERFLLGTSVTFYRVNSDILCPGYFFIVLQSPIWQGQLKAVMAQTTRNQVSIQKQAFFKIPFPPVSEQHRIVGKVDELMALCDRLDTALTTADTTKRRLLEALLDRALASDRNSREAA